MSLKTFQTFLTAAAAALLMIGCGSEESTPDPQRPVPATLPKPLAANKITEKMDPDGKAMHLTAISPAGKKFQASIGDEVEIPDEFPEDVPIFPGSRPMASMSAPDGFIVTFKSSETQQDIFDFYQSSLVESGWEILDEPVFRSPLSLDAVKENRKISVVVAGTKGDSRVSVIVTHVN